VRLKRPFLHALNCCWTFGPRFKGCPTTHFIDVADPIGHGIHSSADAWMPDGSGPECEEDQAPPFTSNRHAGDEACGVAGQQIYDRRNLLWFTSPTQ
jgi:hypothetical protein